MSVIRILPQNKRNSAIKIHRKEWESHFSGSALFF